MVNITAAIALLQVYYEHTTQPNTKQMWYRF